MAARNHSRRGPPGLPKECKEDTAGPIVLGALLLVGGVALAWVLWKAGYYAYITLFAAAGGIWLIGSGVAAARRQSEARVQWERLNARRDQVLEALREVQANGGSPQEWMMQNGFTHRGIRKHLGRALKRPLDR